MAALTTVRVEVPGRPYDVVVGAGAAAALAHLVSVRVPGAKLAAIVTDEVVAAQDWFSGVDPGIDAAVFAVPAGERAKQLATVETLCRRFARAGLGRADVIVAVGGGVVTDLAGFAAAVYHRGIAYCSVATSLLAQVDAAVGGKTGVDLPEGKNLVGAFWQPAGVLCDTALLATLPEREWACGRGEMAKYVFLGAAHLAALPLAEQVASCVGLKAAAVAADERETGGDARVLLNYGHTLAHALEAASLDSGQPEALAHGEAVAVGLFFAALLARRLGRIGDDRVAAHRDVVERFGLSTALPAHLADVDHEELLSYMARDKKAAHDLAFVLEGEQGLELVHRVEAASVRAALDELAGLSGLSGAPPAAALGVKDRASAPSKDQTCT
ncbi:MAG: 3-dehydroquinate synthase [Acidimicrobiales bacterium]